MGPSLPDELSAFLDAYAYPAAIITAGDLTFENARFAALRTEHAPLLHALLAAADAAAPRIETPLASAATPLLAWTLTHQRVAQRGLSVVRTVLLALDTTAGAQGHSGAPLTTAPVARAPGSDHSWRADDRYKAIATGGGELGELIRAYDWQHTSLGPISSWCANLVSAVGMMLSSPLPTSLMWGQDLVLLYNTPYVSLTGPDKHPGVLGKPARVVWSEIWDTIGIPVQAALLQGKMSYFEDQFLLLARRDADGASSMEEVYLTWTYLPIYESSGAVGGVFNPVYDVTARVVSERRMLAMRELGTRLSAARTFTQLLADSCEVLSQLELDLPYAAAYRIQNEEYADPRDAPANTTFILQETIGIPFDAPAAPARVVEGGDAPWDLGLLRGAQNDVVLFDGVQDLLAGLTPRGHAEARPRVAAALPVVEGVELVGCLVVYISGARPVTPALRTFLVLLAREMSTSASVVAAYEDEVQKLEDMAALDRAKTAFFTNISHELRTPLTLILGPVAELYKAGNFTPRQHTDLGVVERNARRLLRLVNSIMDFATAEAGRLTASYQPTHIGPYTLDLASSFRSAAEMVGLELTVKSTLPSNFVVWIDRDKYEKILYNLLSNAIKYTKKGFIQVSAFLEATHFVLCVADSGLGIPKAEAQSIWDKFHRVANAQARSIEGTGIGLALTLELVKLHKGDVNVESEPGQGSTFRVRLPLGNTHLPSGSLIDDEAADFGNPALDGGARMADEVQQWQRSDETDTVSESALSSELVWQPLVFGNGRARARIIVADDNADMRRYVSGLLARYCDVTQCTDGQRAWEELQGKGKEYDLVLSDDMMPAMTGTELLEVIRADDTLKWLPFIMISAKAGDQARLDTLAKGADDYLAKPFKARELLLRVHAQLQATSVRLDLEQRVNEHSRDLEESQKSFVSLCERLQVGIHRSDAQGNLTWCNRKWMDTLGLKENNWDHWGESVSPEDRGMAQEHYSRAIRSGQGYAEPVEMRIKDVQEEGRWLDIIYDLQPEFTPDTKDQISGWIGVWTDVSALRRLQRKHVEVEREHAQQADRSRQQQEQFIDITCHELRNPLNAIYNSAALVGESLARVQTLISDIRAGVHPGTTSVQETNARDSIDTELREDIDSVNTILLCARHQKRITDDVLNVSKLSAGLIALVKQDFSPFDEVKNTVRMFRDEVSARGLTLHFEKDESIDALRVRRVTGDGGRFVQIVVNLLSNAIKFTETASQHIVRVRLGATPVQEDGVPAWFDMQQDDLLPMCRDIPPDTQGHDLYIYVAVADTGHGMTPEEQNRVFQRFAQASPRTYGDFGGHGLGLFVSKMLVELHGGRIQLQSTQGTGTVLRFFIRVQRATTTSPPALPELIEFPLRGVLAASSNKVGQHEDTLPLPTQKFRVLVVEDNLINQRVLVKLLTILDCETATCKDGQECVDLLCMLATPERASEPRFDLILMDLEMPVLDGLGATRRIREFEDAGAFGAYSVPIVAVSGNARDEWTERAQRSGMDGFIRKPYSKEELRNVLNRWRQPPRQTV